MEWPKMISLFRYFEVLPYSSKTTQLAIIYNVSNSMEDDEKDGGRGGSNFHVVNAVEKIP